MGDSTLEKLEHSYTNRIQNHALFNDAWNLFVNDYPPTHCLLDFKELPSTSVALYAGDLGFAILWIVQSVLIRCIIYNINQLQPWPLELHNNTIGAMAHTEPDTNRMIARYSDQNTLVLTGKKNYISGGTDADMVLVTARRPGENKFTKMIYIPAKRLPENALQDINLSILPSIKHSSLTLTDYSCNASQCCPVKDKELRKILKKWSLIERSLIGEAYIAFLLYLVKNIQLPEQDKIIDQTQNLLSMQKSFSRQQLENAFSDKFIDTLGDVASVLSITQLVASHCMENINTLNNPIKARINDLNLFNKLRL